MFIVKIRRSPRIVCAHINQSNKVLIRLACEKNRQQYAYYRENATRERKLHMVRSL